MNPIPARLRLTSPTMGVSTNQYWRRSRKGHVYRNPRTGAFRKELQASLLKRYGIATRVQKGPIKIRVRLCARTNRRYDLDNYCSKGLLDALQGLVFEDDVQVVALTARKCFCRTCRYPLQVVVSAMNKALDPTSKHM